MKWKKNPATNVFQFTRPCAPAYLCSDAGQTHPRRETEWLSFVLIICKTPHKMNRSNHSSENDKKVVCWSTYHKRYYAANRERILARQKRWRTENSEVLKACRKRWYENNKERIVRNQRAYCQQNKEHVRSYRRKYDKDNRERLNKYWRSYYAKNKGRIKQRLLDKKQQTEIGKTMAHCGGWNPG